MRTAAKVVLACLALILAFLYGVAMMQYQLFPFQVYGWVKQIGRGETPGSDSRLIDYPRWKDKTSSFRAFHVPADVVMIGDSITDEARWDEMFPGVRIANRGISSDTTYGLLQRLDGILLTKAKTAFIMVGVNDVLVGRSADAAFADYKKFVHLLIDNGVVPVIQSTIYTSPKQAGSKKYNAKIRELNQRLAAFAAESKIAYVDLNAQLSDADGLKQSVTNDGIHLNGEGYSLWRKAIDEKMRGSEVR
ncbi:GDSL-type esterase/lipase family protein [Noviherbaspirillum autotrophicum]|uniref:SGNH hydrolase-type esterase domain-containing protein n=1 Tax=Noviherbaspirillum autotrophicum TaxID=709839 RepID=A0A0C1YJX1_9BURK|nr:GDSL-type esterase/lipase family protein [Noviherbaspirillum autotrophicum]KIF80765.1 hypothetical protein TSA66_07930 [Noviherbaspirillum autotrophicum]KIF80802.1 hypothetical protein TSA66_08175 [Noviherbaspirillum autotrophicum]KIF84027.1 hypothetical protein TSA66_00865 [Noviherbaspirillum autotrophicum]